MTYTAIRGAEKRTFSPIAIELVDDFLTTPTGPTSAAPLGPITAILDEDDGAGGFRVTDARAFVTSQAVVTFAGVHRRPRPALALPGLYRVRIEGELYRPLYRAVADGIQFTAPAWNDHEPATPVPTFARAVLLPSAAYPFPSYTRVLRGEVLDTTTGLPAVDALVVAGTDSRALSDERGEFALALRWAPDGPLSITATDRAGHTGTISITLPGDLEHGQLIAIS